MKHRPILIIDDDRGMCELVQSGLAERGLEVQWRTDGADGLALATEGDFDAVITDLKLGRMSGLEVCKRLSETRPEVPVIVVTAFGDMESAVAAIRSGAYDFINKPFDVDGLAHAVRKAVENRHLREEVHRLSNEASSKREPGQMVGKSPAMRKLFDLIVRVGPSDTSVLVTGESGTGKELVARALHGEGDRREGPFVAINCAAVPSTLLESELFGHVKGAFTDAKADRLGLFEQADGGTILLDEIGELPPDVQPKLLRVLQERAVRPLGGSEPREFDARIIAATNRDIETDVEEGRFREDLYYRLNVVQLHVPPLRARGNDVLLLAQHFLEQSALRLDKAVDGISTEAAKRLLAYDWPGNVRQLENAMERATTLTRFDKVGVDDLPEKIREHMSSGPRIADPDPEHMLSLAELEQRYIERVLKATGGNKTQAAKVLGLDRRTLYRKLERYERGS